MTWLSARVTWLVAIAMGTSRNHYKRLYFAFLLSPGGEESYNYVRNCLVPQVRGVH